METAWTNLLTNKTNFFNFTFNNCNWLRSLWHYNILLHDIIEEKITPRKHIWKKVLYSSKFYWPDKGKGVYTFFNFFFWPNLKIRQKLLFFFIQIFLWMDNEKKIINKKYKWKAQKNRTLWFFGRNWLRRDTKPVRFFAINCTLFSEFINTILPQVLPRKPKFLTKLQKSDAQKNSALLIWKCYIYCSPDSGLQFIPRNF